MSWKSAASRIVSETFALSSFFRGPRPGFRILMYHAVGTRLKNNSLGIYSIEPRLFERHMAILDQYRHASTVGLCEGRASGKKMEIAVTFDDGYRDNLYAAAPVLQKYKIPFSVFATAAFIQSGSPEYLNPNELRELSELPGVTIGSHGASHVHLAKCDDATLKAELHDSKNYLEDIIGRPVTTIAYPYGSVNLRVRNEAEKAGYVLGVCSRSDTNRTGRDMLLLCRSAVFAKDTERIFRQKLHGDWDWYRFRERDPADVR